MPPARSPRTEPPGPADESPPLVRLGQGDFTRDLRAEDFDPHHPKNGATMSLLDSVITTTTPAPPKILVYGTPGVGKTTFAASAGALLLDCENGAGAVPGLTRTPFLKSWPEVQAWLAEIKANPPEGLGAVAIDTLDWLVQRIVEYVVMDLDKKSKGEVTNTLSSAHSTNVGAIHWGMSGAASRTSYPSGVVILVLACSATADRRPCRPVRW
ncbi:ATP-binding protein [Leptolyngbya sp. 15MV]|nr:ATP-binding protein [Leptolyngbya sp. 15MV]